MRRLGKTAAAPCLMPASWPCPRSAHRRRSRALGGCAGTPMRPMIIRVNAASWFTTIGAGGRASFLEHEKRGLFGAAAPG